MINLFVMKLSFLRHLILFVLGVVLTLGLAPVYSQPILEHHSNVISAELASTAAVSQRLLEQGRSHYQQSQWREAIMAWQTALGQPNLSQHQQATLWSYLGMAHSKIGQWEEGERAIDKALQHLENLSESNDHSHLLAQTLNAQGQLAFAQGRTEAALASWQATTEIYQALNYASGITGSLINQSQALETIGHYRQACQLILNAIDLPEQRCELRSTEQLATIIQAFERQSDVTVQIIGLRSLGQILRLTGQLPEAQQLLTQSVAIAENQNLTSQHVRSLLSLAQVEQDLFEQKRDRFERANRQRDTSELRSLAQKALSQYLEAEQLTTSLTEGHDRLLTQLAVQKLAFLVTLQSANPELSTDELSINVASLLQSQLESINQLPPSPPSRAAILTNIQLARTYISLFPSPLAPPLAETITLLTHTYKQAITLNDTQTQSYALGTLGHLYEKAAKQSVGSQQETWEQAQEATERALQLAQTAQSPHIAYQWQWQLGRILTAQKSNEKAIIAYQAAAQTLQALRQDLVAIDSEAQFSFRDNVEPLYRELVTLLVKSSTETAPSQQNLSQAIQEIDALQLTELENFLNCNLTQTFQLSEPQADTTTAIIYPILLPDQLAVIVRFPQAASQKQTSALHFHHIDISEAQVSQILTDLRQQSENRYISNDFFEQSQQVYDWIIRPIRPMLDQQNIKTLVFVSDGSLRNLPMGILHNGQHFLLEDYAIAISPGLQLPQANPLEQVQLNAIAFGLSEVRPNFQPHAGFSPLANVETELETIDNQLPSRQYLNQDFTANALQNLSNSRRASILHLATHGQFSSDPDNTYLLAWDRRVTLSDFAQILQSQPTATDKDIELLILSACKTASGDNRATLGLAGVAIQSGARSTIASLWAVDDQSTTELMSRLYQELGQPDISLSRAEMLRQAQVELMHTPGYQAPCYWAPYILVGNWS